MINKDVLEIVSFVKDIILGLGGGIAAYVAVTGIRKWKKELRGKTYFEVSFRLLKTVYALRDRLMSARSSFTAVNEMLVKTPDMQNYEIENRQYVFSNRLMPVQETLNDFYSCLPEAEALFGKDFKKTCMEINSVIWEYQHAVNEFMQLWGNTNNDEHLREVSNKVYHRTDKDPLKKKMDDVIEKIETEVTKHIKK